MRLVTHVENDGGEASVERAEAMAQAREVGHALLLGLQQLAVVNLP